MKRSFLLFFFALCFSLAAGQQTEYTITEAELTRLEKISENLETNKRSQQLQVQSLKAELKKALKKSEALSFILQTERETLRSLRQSYAEYEKELDLKIQEYESLIDKLKDKLYRARLALVIVLGLLALIVLSGAGFLFFRIYRKKLL